MNIVDHQRLPPISAMRQREAVRRGLQAVPFRDYATSFTPEQLDVLTTAFYAARTDLTTAGVEVSQIDLASCILHRASKGFFDVAELKKAVLEAFLGFDLANPALDQSLGVVSDAGD